MTDEEKKRAVLDSVLARAAEEGFSVLASLSDRDVFAGGLADLIAFWSAEIDGELERRLQTLDMAELSIRKRIRLGVLTRLDIVRPHKEAARKAALLPQQLGLGAELLWHSADRIWRAAGDRSTDLNFYTKRAIMAGVLSTTMIAWFGDDSEDEAPTAAFLDARIDNVLQFEKLKARFKEACASGKTS